MADETHQPLGAAEPDENSVELRSLAAARHQLRDLAKELPDRVLPVSTTPPTDLATLFDTETQEVKRLLEPGKRHRTEAMAEIRIPEVSGVAIESETGWKPLDSARDIDIDYFRARRLLARLPSYWNGDLLRRWRADLGRFESLRAAVKLRYAERVDWKEYETRVRQLLDRHVVASDAVTIVKPLNIFSDIEIEERRKSESDASIADAIAYQLRREITEKWDEDPVFFEKFSKLVQETIDDAHAGRVDEVEYLSRIRQHRDRVHDRRDASDPTPDRLRDDGHAQAFWGLARRNLYKAGVNDPELAADIALEISKIVQKHRRIGWQHDRDVENHIRKHPVLGHGCEPGRLYRTRRGSLRLEDG